MPSAKPFSFTSKVVTRVSRSLYADACPRFPAVILSWLSRWSFDLRTSAESATLLRVQAKDEMSRGIV